MVTQHARLVAEWQQTAVAGAVFMAATLLAGMVFGRLLRLAPEDGNTVSILFAVRNVALASAIGITLLNRVEYAVFAVVYFLAQVPLLLAVVPGYRGWWAPAVEGADLSRNNR